MNDWKEDFLRLRFPKDGKSFQLESAYHLKYENRPKSIFKYMRFDNQNYSMEHLKYNTVWLSNPAKFNDPFDSVINIDFLKLFQASRIERFIEIAEMKHKVPKEIIEKAKLNSDPECYLQEYILKSLGADDKEIKKYIEFDSNWQISMSREARWNTVHDLRSLIRVSSFCENFDHILMWAHYSDNHKGFCVECDLSTSLENDPNIRYLYPVFYSDDLTDFTNQYESLMKAENFGSLWAKKAAIFKAQIWRYESEWRLIIADGGSMEKHRRFFPIKAIYIGAKIEDENREKILDVAKSKNINVFRMYLSEDRFGLDFEKIS